MSHMLTGAPYVSIILKLFFSKSTPNLGTFLKGLLQKN